MPLRGSLASDGIQESEQKAAGPVTYRVTVMPPAGREQMLPNDRKPQSFDCGCAWNDDRYVMLNPEVLAGPTVVARPPSGYCAVCAGGGKTRERRRYTELRGDVGATDDGGERQGHFRPRRDEEQFLAEGRGWQVQDHDWRGTGCEPGRPKTTIPTLEATKIYFVDVANEVAREFQWIRELDDENFLLALASVTAIVYARAKSANPRELAKWLPTSKSTIYRQRKQGKMLLNQLDRIEQQLRDNAAESRAQWERLFTRLYQVDESEFIVPEYLETEGGTKP